MARYDNRDRENINIDYETYPDYGTDAPRQSHRGLIAVFTLIFIGVICFAVWVFFFSDRGMNLFSRNPANDLSASTQGNEELIFIGIAFDQVSLTMEVGEHSHVKTTFQIPADARDINTRTLKVKWKSENPSVVRVGQYGELWARCEGTARISASIDDPRIDSNIAYCMVLVKSASSRDDDRTESAGASDNTDASASETAPAHSEDVGDDGDAAVDKIVDSARKISTDNRTDKSTSGTAKKTPDQSPSKSTSKNPDTGADDKAARDRVRNAFNK